MQTAKNTIVRRKKAGAIGLAASPEIPAQRAIPGRRRVISVARWAALAGLVLLSGCAGLSGSGKYKIRVIDRENGWPVPMVALRTHNQTFHVTDNNGWIAIDSPELLGRPVWFDVEGSGYETDKDALGLHGVTLTPVRGGSAVVKLKRMLPAKRLGRLTGAGLFAESQKLGMEKNWKESGVLGCDSVQLARHGSGLYWAWGDTLTFANPIGIFHATGAVTDAKAAIFLNPPVRPAFHYFRDGQGQVRGLAQMPGEGPTWLGGMTSLPGRDGKPHLVSAYMKARGALEIHETGLVVWNEKTNTFELLKKLWRSSSKGEKPPPYPDGHPTRWIAPDGTERLLFGDPFPRLEMPATFEAWGDPSQWRVLKPQRSVMSKDGGEKVVPHRGSIAWSKHLQKWVAIFTQYGGKPSHLGEIWFATSKQPTGPWSNAIKVASHGGRTLYNPRIHAEVPGLPANILLFEGTLSTSFANNPAPLPRHDYNQILYRLDLDDFTDDNF